MSALREEMHDGSYDGAMPNYLPERKLPGVISRRGLRSLIEADVAAGVLKQDIARACAMNPVELSRNLNMLLKRDAAWARIASFYGYVPGKQQHSYVRSDT